MSTPLKQCSACGTLRVADTAGKLGPSCRATGRRGEDLDVVGAEQRAMAERTVRATIARPNRCRCSKPIDDAGSCLLCGRWTT